MKIEIKLEDYKYCNGCPFLKTNNEYFYVYCSKYNCELKLESKLINYIRPKNCIKYNGK